MTLTTQSFEACYINAHNDQPRLQTSLLFLFSPAPCLDSAFPKQQRQMKSAHNRESCKSPKKYLVQVMEVAINVQGCPCQDMQAGLQLCFYVSQMPRQQRLDRRTHQRDDVLVFLQKNRSLVQIFGKTQA